MQTYLLGTGTLGYVFWSGARIPHSQGMPPDFYSPQVDMGPLVLHLYASLCISVSLPLLPIWVNVAPLNPWLLDFCTAQFFEKFE